VVVAPVPDAADQARQHGGDQGGAKWMTMTVGESGFVTHIDFLRGGNEG